MIGTKGSHLSNTLSNKIFHRLLKIEKIFIPSPIYNNVG